MMQRTPLDSMTSNVTANRWQVHDIGLGIMDIVQTEGARLPLCVTQAGQTEVDGSTCEAAELARRVDRMLPVPQPATQNVDVTVVVEFDKWR